MGLTRSILAQICDSTSLSTRADYIQSLKLPNLKEGLLGQTCYMLKETKGGQRQNCIQLMS